MHNTNTSSSPGFKFSDGLTLFSVIGVGTTLSFFVCANIYSSMKSKYDKKCLNSDNKNNKDKEDPFQKYKKAFLNSWLLPTDVSGNMVQDEVVPDEALVHKQVELETPVGRVIMRYDPKYHQFQYWTDVSVPYDYLTVVARKFVIQHHCNYLYQEQYYKDLEARETLDSRNNPTSSHTKQNQEPLIKEDEEYLFLKRTPKATKTEIETQQETTSDKDNDKSPVSKIEKTTPNPVRHLVFKKVSSLNEFYVLQEETKVQKVKEDKIKPVSYTEFKKEK
jgi:hypothetical protein